MRANSCRQVVETIGSEAQVVWKAGTLPTASQQSARLLHSD
jgi:hypothetical protein